MGAKENGWFRGVASQAAGWRMQSLIFVGCFLVCFAYLELSMNATIGLYDEGIIVFDARRMMDGDFIHRDFYANYGPAQFFILSELFKLFSPIMLIERLWDTFVRALSVSIAFLILMRATQSVFAALGTALTCMIWFGSFAYYGYPVFPALAAILAGLLFLLRSFEAPAPKWFVFAAGACNGMAFLFRYDLGIFAAAIMSAALALHQAVRPLPGAHRVRIVVSCIGIFSVGFALIAGPVMGLYVAHGAMHDVFFDIVSYPSKNYYRTRSVPFPALKYFLTNTWELTVYLPFLLVGVMSARTIMDLVKQPDRRATLAVDTNLWARITLIVLSTIFIAKGLFRITPIQMSLATITALMLTGVGTANLRAQRGAPYALSLAALLLGAVFTLEALKHDVDQIKTNLHAIVANIAKPGRRIAAQPEAHCKPRTSMPPFGCFWLDKDHLAALEFLQAHTSPGQYIFVGLGRHDKIVLNDVALYFLAGLKSSTKWHQFDPGLQTSAPIQREMIKDLERNPPRYVVLESQWDDIQEPNASALSSGVVLLDNYIRKNFRPVVKFTKVVIEDRRGRP